MSDMMNQAKTTNNETQRPMGEVNKQVFDKIIGILQTLPPNETLELCDALQKCPLLVHYESCPIRFLKREDFQIHKAAKRLSSYWKYRKSFFGDRAYLPMTLTGEGAMSIDDIKHYKMAYQMILPNDSQGRAVVFTDIERIATLSSGVARRCTFYSFHVLSENEIAATDGVVSLGLISTFFFTTAAGRDNIRMINEAMPLKFYATHIFYFKQRTSFHHLLTDFAISFVNFLGIQVSQSARLHVTPSLEERMQKMKMLGFAEDSTPSQLGGCWGVEAHHEWIRSRILFDKNKPMVVNPSSVSKPPPTKPQTWLPFPSLSLQASCRPTSRIGFDNSATFKVNNQATQGKVFDTKQRSDNLVKACVHTQNLRHSGSIPVFNATGHINMSLPSHQQEVNQSSLHTFGMKRIENVARMPTADQTLDVERSSNSNPNALSMLYEALRSIPDPEKSAYFEAKKTNPHLFEQECDPKKFLAVENGNSWEAAKRIAQYWELRKEIFGERAFVPMVQNGQGTLQESDLPALGCGATAVSSCDQDGRDVIIGDISRRFDLDTSNKYASLRALFYLLTVLSENEKTQCEGIVMVLNFMSQRALKVNKGFAAKRAEICNTVPIVFHAIHVVFCHQSSDGQQSIIDSIMSFITQTIMKHKFGNKAIFHRVKTVKEILSELKKYGLNEMGLPSSLGGTWKYEQYVRWLRQRKQYEDTLIRLSFGKDPNSGAESSRLLFFPRMNQKQKIQCLTEEEKKDRKRQLNIIYSRQKRERRKAEADNVQKEYENVLNENRRLKLENQRLEQIFWYAQQKLSSTDTSHIKNFSAGRRG